MAAIFKKIENKPQDVHQREKMEEYSFFLIQERID